MKSLVDSTDRPRLIVRRAGLVLWTLAGCALAHVLALCAIGVF